MDLSLFFERSDTIYFCFKKKTLAAILRVDDRAAKMETEICWEAIVVIQVSLCLDQGHSCGNDEASSGSGYTFRKS